MDLGNMSFFFFQQGESKKLVILILYSNEFRINHNGHY